MDYAPSAYWVLHWVQIYKRRDAWHASTMDFDQATGEGTREKKRRETHQRITDAALKLFLKDGYEATTLDAIAAGAGIARRTFFHYYRSKEEIILAWQSALPDRLYDTILQQEEALSPIRAAERGMVALAADMQPDLATMMRRIIQSDAQLLASNHAKFLDMEQAVFRALCVLWPEPNGHRTLRIVAMASVGAMRLSLDDWSSEGARRPLQTHITEAFATLPKAMADVA